MWQAQVFTLYPDVFPGPLSKGLYGKAMSKNIWNLKVVNIRDAAEDKHKTVDDTPYGGGSGMLMKPDVLAKSLDQNKNEGEKILYLSPRGKKFDQNYAKELSKEKSISIICGHFEGVDERVLSTRNIEEVSIGDFILSGGESAAFATGRLLTLSVMVYLGSKFFFDALLLQWVSSSMLNMDVNISASYENLDVEGHTDEENPYA